MPAASRRFLPVLLALAACGTPELPGWTADPGNPGVRWRSLEVGGGDPGFTAMAGWRTGVDFRNELDAETALENEHLLVGSGVALGDVDGDGWTDVYLPRLEGPNALYLNRGRWRFEDVSSGSGAELPDRFSTGAVLADLDGDGDLDLTVTSLGGPDAVLLNDGTGRFAEAEDAGLEPGLGSTTSALADVDGDGDLDLYLTAYKAESASDALGLLERPMSDITGGRTDTLVVAPEFREHYRVEERDGRPAVVEQADPDRLYLNDGAGRFTPVSWTEGAFLDARGRPLERALDDFGLAARFFDVDGDGHPDLYVCNDFDDPDQLWMGQGDGTFRAVDPLALRTTPHASMSVDFADLDGDGGVEIFVAEMRPQEHRRWLEHIPFQRRLLKPAGVLDDRPQIQRNALFTPVPGAGYAEISEFAGVDATDWTWASLFLDVDLDGYPDLLAVNGYSRDTQQGDVVDEISSLQGQATTRELKRLYPPLLNRNAAFRNRGDLTFEDRALDWGFGTEVDISHGMAPGDLDGDGDLDLVVNRLGAPVRFLRNDADAPRVALRLVGLGGNTAAVGATVRYRPARGPAQLQQVTAGGLYLSGGTGQLTFAPGDMGTSGVLEIWWPDGSWTVVEGVEANRLYEVDQGAAGRSPAPESPSGWPGGMDLHAPSASPDSAPLFADATDELAHVHPEASFEDYFRQPLLPFQPSRLGPGLTWTDVDGDGRPDLVVPPGAGAPLTYLRNGPGGFRETPLAPLAPPLDRTAVIPVAEPGGIPGLIFGQASYEAPDVESARDVPAGIRVPAGTGAPGEPAVLPPGGLSSTGPVAAADLDGDGTLEVFVGGRVIKGYYPMPASSVVLRWSREGLVPDPENTAALQEVGMVSGATFSDVDGDGDPDLLLAVEWGPVKLYRNDGGRLVDASEAWGLRDLRGRWNGVAAGDFDGDGRMDAVVTSWGRNVRYAPTPDRPVILYHGDLDGNGSWDLIPTQDVHGDGDRVSLVEYARLRRAVPSLRRRLPTFREYAQASVSQVLGVDDIYGQVAETYDHQLLLNRGDHFEARPLPSRTLWAPSLGPVVGDLDGDGREDLFLSQNFFPTHLDQPRYDAGFGLVLMGDGSGGFRALTPRASGIAIYGDQRGAAASDFDGDGRLDLAVAQNGGATRLFRNTGARPGVRVRLRGPLGNPHAFGAVLRVVYEDGSAGPAREVAGGSGYWSMNDPVQVMAVRGPAAELLVRWPGGATTRHPLAEGVREVVLSAPRE